MSNKPTDLDDIAESIQDFATMVGRQFEQVNQRFVRIDQRFDRIEATLADMQTEQREMRQWLVQIDGRLSGVESDIAERYDRIVALEKKSRHKSLTTADKKELERKFDAFFAWAEEVSKQTGIALPKL